METPVKNNKTPDLSDIEFMEQLHLLAQIVSTMPGATPTHANVTTPAPIRARWAAYMVSLGVRVDPDLATHKLIRGAGMAAGNHAPHTLQRLTRESMWQQVKEQSPELYEKYQRGEATADDFLAGIDGDLMHGLRQAMEEAERERKEKARDDSQRRSSDQP